MINIQVHTVTLDDDVSPCGGYFVVKLTHRVADDNNLIIFIEPNVDTFSHADEKSTSYQVDREFSSGFQDHSGNAGTAGQPITDVIGEEQL